MMNAMTKLALVLTVIPLGGFLCDQGPDPEPSYPDASTPPKDAGSDGAIATPAHDAGAGDASERDGARDDAATFAGDAALDDAATFTADAALALDATMSDATMSDATMNDATMSDATTSDATMSDAGMPSPTDGGAPARAFFTSPSNGARVGTTTLFGLGVEGIQLVPEIYPIAAGTGHLHVHVDAPCAPAGSPIATSASLTDLVEAQTSVLLELPLGPHVLCVQAGDSAHVAFGATDVITVLVE